MATPAATDVVVVGAGITGLVAAYRLSQAKPSLDVSLYEASERAGGVMGTESVDGFLFERGPNSFQNNVADTLDLARDVGVGDRLLAASGEARRRYLYHDARLLPLGPKSLFVSSLLPLGQRFRLLGEPFRGSAPPGVEESVGAFGRRRFGSAVVSTLLDPIVTGVYAGDVEKIGVEVGFPRLAAFEREHGSLLRGLWKTRGTMASRRLYSFTGGLQELVDALSSTLGDRLQLGATVSDVKHTGGRYRLSFADRDPVDARSVVVAVPPPRAARFLGAQNPVLARGLDRIPYASVAVLCLGYPREAVTHPLDGFGFLVPRQQRLRTLGAIFVSSLFPPHAPDGAVSLRVMLGGAHDPEVVGLSVDEIQAMVIRELGPVLGLSGEPVARGLYRYIEGIPQYNVGHLERLQGVDSGLWDRPGLFLTGNAYRGVGINDCVAEGGRVAREVVGFLERG